MSAHSEQENSGKIRLQVAFRNLIDKQFDYDGFCKAIDADDLFSAEQKQHVKNHLSPKTAFAMSKPSELISEAINFLNFIAVGMKAEEFDLDNADKEPLRETLPLNDVWREVWQKSLAHYALEAAEYEQALNARGDSLANHPALFPLKAPNILCAPDVTMPLAAIGFGDDTEALTLIVGKGFLSLPEDQQKAILYHEAHHAFEAVIQGLGDKGYFISHTVKSIVTRGFTARRAELRADELPAKMGYSENLAEFFEGLEKLQDDVRERNSALMRHLSEHGLQFDPEAVLTLHAMLCDAVEQLKGGASIGLDDPEEDAAQDLSVLGKGVEIVRQKLFERHENQLLEQVKDLNEQLRTIHESQKEASESPPAPNGFRERLERLRGTLEEKREDILLGSGSHPPHAQRVKRLRAAAPCPACTTDSPYASHTERLETVSDTGFQVIRR